MINLLRKLRISASLDSGKAGSAPGTSGAAARLDEVRTFRRSLHMLDQALREQTPARPELPAGLHACIMRAVRATQAPSAPQATSVWLRWVAGPAFAAAVVLLMLSSATRQKNHPDPASQTLNSALATMERGSDFARAMPSTIMAPLSRELTSLSSDVEQTANFLMASLP